MQRNVTALCADRQAAVTIRRNIVALDEPGGAPATAVSHPVNARPGRDRDRRIGPVSLRRGTAGTRKSHRRQTINSQLTIQQNRQADLHGRRGAAAIAADRHGGAGRIARAVGRHLQADHGPGV